MILHARRRQNGQAIVESALVTLVFVAILIGILDLGQILFVRQTFAARVRAAARYAVVNAFDAAAVRNMVLYGRPAASPGSGIFGLTAAMVQVSQHDLNTSAARVVVTVSNYPYRMFSPWIGRAFNGRPITASFSMETP